MIVDLMGRVAAEVARQYDKWGEQNHPDIHPGVAKGDELDSCMEVGLPTEGQCKAYNAELEEAASLYWYAVLVEEVSEAHAAACDGDDDRQIEELVQVMAVCATQIDCIQRRRGGK